MEPTTTYTIDWLSISVSEISKHDNVLGKHKESVRGLAFYTNGEVYEYGRIDKNERKKEQKILITITGDDWACMAADGKDPKETLSTLLAMPHAVVTRLDFAVDLKHGTEKVSDVIDAWNAGKVRCSAKKLSRVGKITNTGEDCGTTAYIGSRQSEVYLRVYDKGKQKEVEENWVRIEVETKGRWAMATALDMVRGDVVESGKAVIRQYVTMGVDWFDNAVKIGPTGRYVLPGKRPLTDHEKWLLEVACPAVIKAIDSDNQEVVRALVHALRAKGAID